MADSGDQTRSAPLRPVVVRDRSRTPKQKGPVEKSDMDAKLNRDSGLSMPRWLCRCSDQGSSCDYESSGGCSHHYDISQNPYKISFYSNSRAIWVAKQLEERKKMDRFGWGEEVGKDEEEGKGDGVMPFGVSAEMASDGKPRAVRRGFTDRQLWLAGMTQISDSRNHRVSVL